MPTIYQQSCPVLFGVDAIEQIGEKANGYGARKALCIYDKGVKLSGIADRVVKLLRDAGIETVEFGDVLPDAPDTTINALGAQIHDAGIQLVVGIGGGSSMDTANGVCS